MKTLRYFANTAFVLSLAMFASCSSDNDIEKNDENKESASVEEMVFTASFEGDETTRAILTKESSSTERMHWQEGDKILLTWPNNTSTGTSNKATISKMYSNGTKAEFTGSSIPSDKSYYAAIYPDDAVSAVSGNQFTTQIKTLQTVTSGYSYDKSAMLMIARTTSSYDKNLEFKNIPALIKVTLTNNDDVRYIRVRSNQNTTKVTGSMSVFINPSTKEITANNFSATNNFVQLDLSSADSPNGAFYMAIIPKTPFNNGFTFELEKNDGSIYSYGYTSTVTFDRSVIYDFGTFNVSELPFLKDVVNLGLPSGTLWCMKNITAGSGTSTTFVNSIYDNGGYYAWGDVLAYNQDDGNGNKKTEYKSSTYTWGDDIYTNSTLKDEYDAAYQIEGHLYCMPTYIQMKELYDNCTVTNYTSTAYNGHYGLLLTSKINGNTLWLPAAGYRCNQGTMNGLQSVNSKSHYWSKTLYTAQSSRESAYCLDFSGGSLDNHGLMSEIFIDSGEWYDRRLCGKCIRPVVRK